MARDEKYNVSITNVTDSTSALGIAGPKASGLFDAVTAKGSAKAADFRFLDAKKVRTIFKGQAFMSSRDTP